MNDKKIRRIIFLTGTRADFGKLKSLISKIEKDDAFEVHIFVTGMHMLSKYGLTADEVKKSGYKNIYRYINQNTSDSMDNILAKTILGLSDFIKEVPPDLLVIHGDRAETLAGAIVGALNNILVAHIEGGEVSGTVDELIRHSVSKLSHIHLVANQAAKKRLLQLGESEESIHIVGSPDIDVMNSSALPNLDIVKTYYDFNFKSYSILLFHSVTTDIPNLRCHVRTLVDQIIKSNLNYLVIFPNNDPGTEIIIEEYLRFNNNHRFKVYPSMRFEYFLTALKNADFIIGNSSAGVREAPHLGLPAINLGSRQQNRVNHDLVINCELNQSDIINSISKALAIEKKSIELFGDGKSADIFHQLLQSKNFWKNTSQKYFIDRRLADDAKK